MKPRLTMLKPRVQTIGNRLPTMQPGSWRTDKTTTAERGYGGAWQRARLAHLRKHPLCVKHEARGELVAASVVDHRVPHRGDMVLFWDSSNWQSLCATCHSSDKQREEAKE